jgi:hypothetical protein
MLIEMDYCIYRHAIGNRAEVIQDGYRYHPCSCDGDPRLGEWVRLRNSRAPRKRLQKVFLLDLCAP